MTRRQAGRKAGGGAADRRAEKGKMKKEKRYIEEVIDYEHRYGADKALIPKLLLSIYIRLADIMIEASIIIGILFAIAIK